MRDDDMDITTKFNAAVDYAAEILTDFHETSRDCSVATLLEELAYEYSAALQEDRGMDPRLVKWAVQNLLDAVRFDPDNAPDEYDPDSGGVAAATDLGLRSSPPLFRYVKPRPGRKPSKRSISGQFNHVLGALVGRFGLHPSRNAEPKLGKPLDGAVSAIDAVAAAMTRLKRLPRSPSGIRKAIENDGSGGLNENLFFDAGVKEGEFQASKDAG